MIFSRYCHIAARCTLFLSFIIISTLYPSITFAAENFTLSNGMQVVVIPKKNTPAITHMVWYKAGAVNEESGKSGLAHFFEHLMFKATKNLSDGEFSRLVAVNGGNENAFTTHDYTAYFQTIAKEHLELVMSLEAERMVNLQLNEEVVHKERNIVLEERNMRVDNNPDANFDVQMKAALYPNHPYGIPVIGWKDEIERFSLESAQAFYKAHYAPNNAILVIAGDITAQQIKSLAEKYYGSIPAQNISPRIIPKRSTNPIKHDISIKDPRAKRAQWVRDYLSPSATAGKTEYTSALAVLCQLFGGSETSRLYQSLVVKNNLAVQAATSYNEISLGEATFSIQVTPKDGVTFNQIQQAVGSEIKLLLDSGVSNEELQRAKNLLVSEAIYARDGLSGMAFIYGQAVASGLDTQYIDNWPEKIAAVDRHQLRAAAEYLLKSENFVTGTLSSDSEVEK